MANKRKVGEMTDTSVLSPEFFRDDLDEMYDDISKIGELATRIDDDINHIYFSRENRDMIGRGVLPFVSEQLKTLASLRTSKSSALNQVMSNKLKISQLALSKLKSDEGNGTDATAIAREFQKLFLDPKNKRPEDLPENQFKQLQMKPANVVKTEDDLLDQRIGELSTSGSFKLTDNEQAIKYEKSNVQIQVSVSGEPHFIAINGNTNEVLNDYPPTLLPNHDILKLAIVTTTHYECSNGKKYQIHM